MPRNQLIQPRNGTAATWTSVNPVLAVAELGIESDTGQFKIGDGVTVWNSLVYAASGSGVTSFNTRHGAITLTKTDVTATGLGHTDVGADAAGAAATAQTTAETFATNADTTVLSSAESFATSAVGTEATARSSGDATNATAISAETTRAEAAEALLAPISSPALTGNPTAPTQTALNDSTRLATTAYADLAVGVEKTRALAAEALLAPLASPSFTGSPTAPTKSALNNSPDIATTAYADSAVAVEVSRAETAEAAAQSNAESFATSAVATETTRAEAAEASKASLASPAFTGNPTSPTQTPLDNSTKIATTAYADLAVAVETSRAETAEALKAPLASPALTGSPTAPTKSALNNSTDIATTAYADAAVAVEVTRAEAAEVLLAPLASPALTGTPTAPTKTALTNNTDIATTAYADAAVAVEVTRAEAAEGTNATAISTETSRAETAEGLLAPKASPALTGTPTAPTATGGTNTTQIATTAFVEAALSGAGDVTSVFGRAGTVVATSGDYTVSQVTGAAPLASPALTGSPTAPTQTPLTSSGDIASTAYADAAVAVEVSRAETAEALLAPKASPTFTGHITTEGVTATGATGTGEFVFQTSPTLITPTLGVANATTVNKVTITAPATGSTITVADGKTLTVNHTMTFTSAGDSGIFTFPNATATIARSDSAQTFSGVQTFSSVPVFSAGIGSATATTQSPLNNSTDVATTAYADAAVAVEKARAEAAEGTTFNVKTYGAAGDGVTDDTAAILAAFKAAQGLGTLTFTSTTGGTYTGIAPTVGAAVSPYPGGITTLTSAPAIATATGGNFTVSGGSVNYPIGNNIATAIVGTPGAEVYFPYGEYKITSTIFITQFAGLIHGDGMGQSPSYGPQPGLGSVIRWSGPAPVTATATATNGTTTLTVPSVSGIFIGQVVTGAGITSGGLVSGISGLVVTITGLITTLTTSTYTFTSPMIQIIDSWETVIQDLRLEGNNTNPPSFGIQCQNNGGATGCNHFLTYRKLYIGQYPWSSQGSNQGNVQTCVGYTGINGNNDQFHIEDTTLAYPTKYGIYLPNNQSTWGSIKDCVFQTCGIAGLATNATTTLFNPTFNSCAIDLLTGVDGDHPSPPNNPNIIVTGWHSEGTGQMANISPDTSLTVKGGTVQQGTGGSNVLVLIDAFPSDRQTIHLEAVRFDFQPPVGRLTFTSTTGGTYTSTAPVIGAPILPYTGGIATITSTPVIATASGGNFTVSGGSVTLAGTNLASANQAMIEFGPSVTGSYVGEVFVRVHDCAGLNSSQLVMTGTMWAASPASNAIVEWTSSDGLDLSTAGANKQLHAFRNELTGASGPPAGMRATLNNTVWDAPVARL